MNMSSSIEAPVLTVDEAVAYLRIPKSSLYKLAQEGKVPCQKVGRHWRFHKAALEKWLGTHVMDIEGTDLER